MLKDVPVPSLWGHNSRFDPTPSFDRFYRVKNDQTRSITGTGLGLAIVKSIVETHHGFVRVESEPERGSAFFVDIPLIPS